MPSQLRFLINNPIFSRLLTAQQSENQVITLKKQHLFTLQIYESFLSCLYFLFFLVV
jgi:hypothetical protein